MSRRTSLISLLCLALGSVNAYAGTYATDSRNVSEPCTVNCGSSGGGSDESPVPEPATLLLLGTGLALIARGVRRKAR
jgi:hypothetical protein